MFDNLLNQPVGDLLETDILNDRLPGSILLSGPAASGKLTCALELARVLSCRGNPKGQWTCTCTSCLQHKALVDTKVLLTGPRDCLLEISAAKKTFLDAAAENKPFAGAARYLFIRSIRKLTMRFSPVLWQDDDRLSKISVPVSAIDEYLEELDPPRALPSGDKLIKLCDDVEKQCQKLEDSFMYDSLPVIQIRNIAAWAHLSSGEGKKVVIIENADRMLDSVRNALLKILEEPPADTFFVLTTVHRGAVLPTILSRVRTYAFSARTPDQQKDVVRRVFHADPANLPSPAVLDSYLRTFLPVSPDTVVSCAVQFFDTVARSGIPDVSQIVKTCCNFSTRLVLRIFLEALETCHRELLTTASGTEAAASRAAAIHTCWINVSVYNQSPVAALEQLIRSLSKINVEHSRVFRTVVSGV